MPELLSRETLRPRDLLLGCAVFLAFVFVGWVSMMRPNDQQLRVSNYGPRNIPTENVASGNAFPVWMIVENVNSSSRILVDEKPVPSVVDAENHAVTTIVPSAAFSQDGKVLLQVVDPLGGRSSDVISLEKTGTE